MYQQWVAEERALIKACFGEQRPYWGHMINSVSSPPGFALHLKACVQRTADAAHGSALNILEVGCFAGISTLAIMEGIHQFNLGHGCITVIDPGCHVNNLYPNEAFDHGGRDLATWGQLDLLDYNATLLGWRQAIHLQVNYSGRVLPSFPDAAFDLISIDGDHEYASVLTDMREAARLLKRDGMMCGDDYGMPGVRQAYHEVFPHIPVPPSSFWTLRRTNDGFEPVNPPIEAAARLDFLGDQHSRFLATLAQCGFFLFPPKSWRFIHDRAEAVLRQYARVAIYGAGKLTSVLLRLLDPVLVQRVDRILDDRPESASGGLPLTPVRPDTLRPGTLPDAILVCCEAWDMDMMNKARSRGLSTPVYSVFQGGEVQGFRRSGFNG